jgi:hypothetical protein
MAVIIAKEQGGVTVTLVRDYRLGHESSYTD